MSAARGATSGYPVPGRQHHRGPAALAVRIAAQGHRNSFEARAIEAGKAAEIDLAARYILDELGIVASEPEERRLDTLIERFGLQFPDTASLSRLARSSLKDLDPVSAPDEALLAWMEREEQLFRRLERRIVEARLKSGFMTGSTADVDGFLQFSLSVQNRRKARAGLALENHLEALFTAHHLRFDRGKETENRNKPDFLFPWTGRVP